MLIAVWPQVYPFTSFPRRWTRTYFSNLFAETTAMWCGSKGVQRQHRPMKWADRFSQQIPIVNGWVERHGAAPQCLTSEGDWSWCLVRAAYEHWFMLWMLLVERYTFTTPSPHDPLGLEQPQPPSDRSVRNIHTGVYTHTHTQMSEAPVSLPIPTSCSLLRYQRGHRHKHACT